MKLRLPLAALAAAAALGACGHSQGLAGDAGRGSDSGSRGSDSGGGGSGDGGATDAAGVDAAPGGVDCFYDWSSLGTCGAPVITAAYLTTDCQATSGVFVVGHGFESANLYMVNNAWLPYGPRVISSSWNGNFWNVLTPTFMCVTTSPDPGTWSGFAIQLRNPDGQLSNTVTVQDLLSARPALVSTGSDDPFDPDACLDPGMTQSEALATFAPGASSSTIGTVTITSRTRSCNTATGCLPWGSPATVASNVTAGLAITGSGSTIDLTLAGTDCGRLGEYDATLTYNDCSLSSQLGGDYSVHVAAHCLQISQTKRSQVAGDGSYTQTDAAALLRY